MRTVKLDSLESMEQYKATLPPVFWGYQVKEFPKRYFEKDYVKKFYVEKLKSNVVSGKPFYKPISKL